MKPHKENKQIWGVILTELIRVGGGTLKMKSAPPPRVQLPSWFNLLLANSYIFCQRFCELCVAGSSLTDWELNRREKHRSPYLFSVESCKGHGENEAGRIYTPFICTSFPSSLTAVRLPGQFSVLFYWSNIFLTQVLGDSHPRSRRIEAVRYLFINPRTSAENQRRPEVSLQVTNMASYFRRE